MHKKRLDDLIAKAESHLAHHEVEAEKIRRTLAALNTIKNRASDELLAEFVERVAEDLPS